MRSHIDRDKHTRGYVYINPQVNISLIRPSPKLGALQRNIFRYLSYSSEYLGAANRSPYTGLYVQGLVMFEWVQTVQTFKVEIGIYDIIIYNLRFYLRRAITMLRHFDIYDIRHSNRSNVQSWNRHI